MHRKEFDIISHRGYCAGDESIENTNESIRNSIALRAEFVEFDVHMTRDGIIILNHDSTTRCGHEIETTDYSTIKESVDTLDSVLSANDGCATQFIIELKTRDMSGRFIATLDAIVQCYPMMDIMYSSFNHNVLYSSLTHITFGALMYHIPTPAQLRAIRPRMIGIDYEMVTPDIVKMFHDNGHTIYCYTPNTLVSVERLIRAGVDGVYTDNYASVTAMYREKYA